MRVLVVGAGGHGQVVADILIAGSTPTGKRHFLGYLDDDAALQTVNGYPVLGAIRRWRDIDHDGVVVAIGDNAIRRKHFDALRAGGAHLVTARHPATTVAADVRIEDGAMLCAGVIVNTQARIGANTIVNTAASIDHHCRIGDHAHLAPGVRLGGGVDVGEGALVGIGAVVLPEIKIGAWAIVGAGAVVTSDVDAKTTVVGVPARALVHHVTG